MQLFFNFIIDCYYHNHFYLLRNFECAHENLTIVIIIKLIRGPQKFLIVRNTPWKVTKCV